MNGDGSEEGSTTSSTPDDLQREQLLAGALAALREGSAALDAYCGEHREHADWLRRQLEFLDELGLLHQARAADGMPRVLGDFELLRRIGGGGMGVVFAATQRSLGREVAVKIVRPEMLPFEHAQQRFQREIAAVAKLQHPAVIRIVGAGEAHGVPYLAMELLRGRTLAERLAELADTAPERRRGSDLHPRFTGTWPNACALLIAEVAAGLQHAHDRGVLHRDLKPSNVVLTDDGQPVVIDFGLAVGDDDEPITRTLAQIGSAPYCAPERLIGAEAADEPCADVYGLGAVLYELLTARPAFADTNLERLRRRVLRGEFPPVRERNRDVSRDLAVVTATAMAPARRRYATMAAFAADLQAVLEHRPIAARPPGPGLRLLRWLQRNAALAALTGLGLVLAVGIPVALLMQAWARAAERAPLLAMAEADGLIALESELWPTSSAYLEGRSSYGRWLERAAELLAQRSSFEGACATLRAQGRRAVPGQEAGALSASRLRAELAEDEASDAWMGKSMGWGAAARRVPLRERMAAIRWQLDTELGWEFDDVELEQRHAQLSRLLWRLREVELLVDDVRLRQEHAARIAIAERAAVGAYGKLVEELRADARHPGYRALALRPQAGLVPLGRDPESGLFEFAHLPSGEPAQRDAATGRLRIVEATGIVLVLLPGGAFRMGAGPRDQFQPDADAVDIEGPSHEVELAPFFLGKHEVTQAQWVRLMKLNPSMGIAGAPGEAGGTSTPITLLHPVEAMTWDQARTAVRRWGLDLPTEAQWECAARAGGHAPFGEVDEDHLVGRANLKWDRDPWRFHAPVGTFAANGFGLHDMIGNVQEWCLDGGESYRVAPAAGNGMRPCRPDCPRSVRGGCYDGVPMAARVSARPSWPPGTALMQVGMRVSRRIE